MDTDLCLIQKMKKGDDRAFEQFIRKYYDEIATYCYYHCHDHTYALDLTQETFVRFFSSLPRYHYRRKTKNYLYTIAGNLCKDYYKKVKEVPFQPADADAHAAENQPENLLEKFTIEWALEKLPTELSDVILLHYFQELKLTEIADLLKISLPLVKYRLKKAKNELRKLLQ